VEQLLLDARISMVLARGTIEEYSRRMLKKAVQQGRRELGDRSDSFSTRPPRAAKTAQSPGGTLQGDGRLRTMLGKGRVSARRGWAGEKDDFFSILPDD
jgi:hypothetical protein